MTRSRQALNVAISFALGALAALIALGLPGRLGENLARLWLPPPAPFPSDTFFELGVIATLVRGDWHPFGAIHSARLGAPFGMNLSDFPIGGSFHFLMIKALSIFTINPIFLYNAYYLLSYPLAAAAMAYALSRLIGPKHFLVVPCALVFALLPYHFARLGHLYLACYFLIPLVLRLILSLDAPISIPSFFLLALFGSAGVYYAFFACFFFLAMGSRKAWQMRRGAPLARALACILVIGAGFWLDMRPALAYRSAHGVNPSVAQRRPLDAELYGFKLSPFLLPPADNRIAPLAAPRRAYDAGGTITKGGHESAGTIAALCALFLCGSFLVGRKDTPPLRSDAAFLFIVGVAFAEVGGFGSLFAALVSPSIRCYERIYPFLAALALIGTAAGVDPAPPRRRAAIIAGLAVLQFLDISSSRAFQVDPQDDVERSFYLSVARLTQDEPTPQVLQLPFTDFPESGSANMSCYAHLAGVVFAPQIRWSQGIATGRAGYKELIAIRNSRDVPIKEVCALGYTGLTVDRLGYSDENFTALARNLRAKLAQRPDAESSDGRLLYYSLSRFCHLRPGP